MFHTPPADLNEEERALLGTAPEDCLRSALQRGVLSLDPITENLTPRAATVVRSIAAGERLSSADPSRANAIDPQAARPGIPLSAGAVLYSMLTGERAGEPSTEEAPLPPASEPADDPEIARAREARWQADYQSLATWPGLQQAVDEGILTPSEALDVANAIDLSLGRYMTGTLYAAP